MYFSFFSFHNPRWLNCKKNCLHPAIYLCSFIQQSLCPWCCLAFFSCHSSLLTYQISPSYKGHTRCAQSLIPPCGFFCFFLISLNWERWGGGDFAVILRAQMWITGRTFTLSLFKDTHCTVQNRCVPSNRLKSNSFKDECKYSPDTAQTASSEVYQCTARKCRTIEVVFFFKNPFLDAFFFVV